MMDRLIDNPMPRPSGLFPICNRISSAEAETKIKREIFEGRFGQLDLGSEKLADFIEKVFVPWSKANKRSWKHDEFRARTIREYFGGKTFREISPLLVEKFKRDRRESITARQTVRSLASVNFELNLLVKIFNLAIDYQVTDTNPCMKALASRKSRRVSEQL